MSPWFGVLFELFRGVGNKGAKPLFIQAVEVAILSANALFLHQNHDGIIKGLHTVLFTGLQHGGNLKGLGIADEISNRWRGDQNFKCSAPAFAITAFKQGLRHDRLQGIGQGRSDLLLLLIGEHIDHAIDRFVSALRVHRTEYEMPGRGRFDREADGFQIPQFSNENDIGVFPQGRAQGGGEGFGMGTDLPVIDETIFAFMNEFNRVLDG